MELPYGSVHMHGSWGSGTGYSETPVELTVLKRNRKFHQRFSALPPDPSGVLSSLLSQETNGNVSGTAIKTTDTTRSSTRNALGSLS